MKNWGRGNIFRNFKSCTGGLGGDQNKSSGGGCRDDFWDFSSKNVKIVSIISTIRLVVDLLLDPQYTCMLKSKENKAPTPIFHVESIFDGFRTIGTRKMG